MHRNCNNVFIIINKIFGSQWVSVRENVLHFTSVLNRRNDRKIGRIKILDVLRPYQSNGTYIYIYIYIFFFFFKEKILFKILSALPVTVYVQVIFQTSLIVNLC